MAKEKKGDSKKVDKKDDKKVDKVEDAKSELPKDENKVDAAEKSTNEEPKMLRVKENSSIGVFILLIGMNIFACALLKHHFANVLKELDGHINDLEQNTNLLYQ